MKYKQTPQGKSLTELLEKSGIKKAELAKQLKLHRSYFTKIEKEQVVISEDLYWRILKFFEKEKCFY